MQIFWGFSYFQQRMRIIKRTNPKQVIKLHYINKGRALTQFEQKPSLMDCKSSSIHQFHTDIAISQEDKRCPALQAVRVDAKSSALWQGHATGISPLTAPTEVKQQGHRLTRQHSTPLIQARQIETAPNQPKNYYHGHYNTLPVLTPMILLA